MSKLIFLDVDGTLVDYENRIPPSAIEAVKQARANGHKIFVCTGRSRAEIQPEIWQIEIDGLIGGNGAYVEYQNQVLMHRLIPEDSAAAFPELKAGTWGGVGETALFGDLGVKEIDKGYAVSVLLEHLNAEQKDTIAFGNAKADIPMLEYCAIGVAMGNGGEEIKAMADFVTDDVNADGLYNAFKHFNLI